MESKKEIRIGAFLSYFLLLLNTVYGLLVAPFILRHVGQETYGVYKTIASLSASLAVADLGLSSTMTRYIAKFLAEGDKKKANNFIGMMFIQCSIVAFFFISISFVAYTQIDTIYASTFSRNQMLIAKNILLILSASIVIRLFENLAFGILSGSERFSYGNGIKIVSLLLKIFLIFVLLPLTHNILIVVASETIVAIISLAAFLIYSKRSISLFPKLIYWDKRLFKESLGYTVLMLAQTITIQFNGNVDNILIGALIGASSVAVYSMALLVFNMYENLAGSISNLMLPSITKKVVAHVGYKELEKDVIKVGRIQYFILGAALGGFFLLGRDFFNIWLGNGYDDCYYLTLVLMVSVTLPIVESVTLSILRAENKMLFRTIALIISCLFNIGITIVGINYFGYFGAVIGTAASKIIGLVIMNVYYKKKYGFRIFSLFFNILAKTSFCILITTLVLSKLRFNLPNTIINFALNAFAFVFLYCVLLAALALNTDEKLYIKNLFNRKKEA